MAQRSNRSELIEGTLRCLERLPPERITARAIAAESGANLASITYHFGSKENLVTEAVIKGLDRWLADLAQGLAGQADPARPEAPDAPETPEAAEAAEAPESRFRRAAQAAESSRRRHTGLARTFVVALGRAQHDAAVRMRLAEGFHRARPALAAVLGLGDDQVARDTAGLILALFDGWLLQALLDPALVIDGDRMRRALARLRTLLSGDDASGTATADASGTATADRPGRPVPRRSR